MGISKTEKPDGIIRLNLPSDCTLRSIAAVSSSCREAFASGKTMVFDAAAVEAADFTFVQLVVSAQRSLAQHGRRVTLDGASPAVLSAFSRAGVAAPEAASSLPSGAQ